MNGEIFLFLGFILSAFTVLQAQDYAVGGSVKAWYNHRG